MSRQRGTCRSCELGRSHGVRAREGAPVEVGRDHLERLESAEVVYERLAEGR